MRKPIYVAACLALLSAGILVTALRSRSAPPADAVQPGGAARGAPGSNAEAERANRERLRSLGYLN